MSGSTDTSLLDRVRDAWSERAARWDERSEANRTAPDRAADLARTRAALQLEQGTRLLDAGCGSGQFALEFAAGGCQVTAIDVSPEMIRRARAHGAARGISVDWRAGDVTTVADPDASYDAIMARVSLQFVPDPLAALREFRRLLHPGGRLFASVPGALSPIYQDAWRRFVTPAEVITNGMLPWELETLLTTEGWTIHDGWGEFGQDLSGRQNPLSANDVAAFDIRLQQAAATIWTFIASSGPAVPAS